MLQGLDSSMRHPLPLASLACLLLWSMLPPGLAPARQDPQPKQSPPKESEQPVCTLDLTSFGKMSDIVSNALTRELGSPEAETKRFLAAARSTCFTGEDLILATAAHYKLSEQEVRAAVERYRHSNCTHPGGEVFRPETENQGSMVLTKFARNVTMHVVLHELGHALIREFDLPVLANEETAADAFATHYLTTHLPDIALAVLQARCASLMLEARELPRAEWPVDGEHNSDARRAFQIAALALAADPVKYLPLANSLGMSPDRVRKAKDYGTEIHRSWRRILQPLWLAADTTSHETRLRIDSDSSFLATLDSTGLPKELFAAIQRFDWHSQVSLHFAKGDGGAGWNRSKRTITVHTEYIQRFVRQGALLKD